MPCYNERRIQGYAYIFAQPATKKGGNDAKDKQAILI